MSNNIPAICAEAARAWNTMLKDGVLDPKLRCEAVDKAMKAVKDTGMPLQAVLDRGEQELRAQMMGEG